MYSMLLESIRMLYSDPSPYVAFMSRKALRAVDFHASDEPDGIDIRTVPESSTQSSSAGKAEGVFGRGSASPQKWKSHIFPWKNRSDPASVS